MKFVSFININGEERAGWIEGQKVYDMNELSDGILPSKLLTFIEDHEKYTPILKELLKEEHSGTYNLGDTELLAPIPRPPSVRDFMSFELHLKNAYKNLEKEIPKEWYEAPAFYFTNHHAIIGPETPLSYPSFTKCLDFELEIACVIGKQGKDIKAGDAEDYIFGFTILNDWSARDIQMEEIKIGLGPAKGKDFATSIGPYIVTKESLQKYKIENRHDLTMTARINGKEISKGNLKDIHYSFADMIERASINATLYPGDIIGSGTVGTGCLLELSGVQQSWLIPGDTVELEVTELGILKNTIVE